MKKILKWALALLVVAVFVYMTYGTGTEQAAVNSVYPPLSPATDGRPQIAAHYLELGEDGQVKLALQVLAPGSNIEAVRIDNVGGQASLWRSDSDDSEAKPITVSNKGQVLSSAGGKMNLGPLGKAEEYLEFALPDNGAFKGGQTEFRVTVFLAGGERANCLLPVFDPAKLATAAPKEPRIQEEAKSEETSPEEDRSFVDKLKEQFFSAKKAHDETESLPIVEPPLDIPTYKIHPSKPPLKNDSLASSASGDENQYIAYNGWRGACRVTKEDSTALLEKANHNTVGSSYYGSVSHLKNGDGVSYSKSHAYSVLTYDICIRHEKELSEDDFILMDISGYFNVKEPGPYIFSVINKGGKSWWHSLLGNGQENDIHIPKAVYIENTRLAAGSDTAVVGMTGLLPGLYSVSFAAIIPLEDFESDPNPLQHIDIMLKRPSDDEEIPIPDVLLGRKMSAEEIKDLQEAASDNEETFSDKVKGHISDIIADTIKKVL